MSDYNRTDLGPGRRSRALPIAILLAFVAGLLVMGWALTRWPAAAPFLSWMRPGAEPLATAPAAPRRPAATRVRPDDVAALEAKMARLEARLATLSTRADAAQGNVDRTESLLVAFAARRAVDRGIQLGYVEGLLRDHFGQSHPRAVATILSAARKPVTLADLEAGLDEIAPVLVAPPPSEGLWSSVRRELADLVIVRRTDLPSTAPVDRLARARRELAADHVARALVEVARLPARDRAADWIAMAHRYIAAHDALDRIEAATLLSEGDRPGRPPRR